MTVVQMNHQTPWYKVPVAVQTPSGAYLSLMGMIDTGAASEDHGPGLFIGTSLANKLNLPILPDGNGYSGTILVQTAKTQLPDLLLGGTHYGPQAVTVLPDSPDVPINFFIGTQFLKQHEAILNLKTGTLDLQA